MCSTQSARSPGIRLGVAALLVAGATALVLGRPPDTVPAAGGTFDVTHYTVALDLDVDAGVISGTERIELTVRDTTASLIFDSGTLVVDAVRTAEARGTLLFVQQEHRLIVTLPSNARPGDRRAIEITYHGAPRTGLTQLPTEAYTTFSTSQWMVAVDAPSDRATLDLEVAIPSGWKAAGSGRQLSVQARGGKTAYRWRQDRAVSSFLYGFVAGAFAEAADTYRGVTLNYLGSPFSTDELRRIFRHTPAIMAFMEERAGMPYPGERYTQALVSTSSGQELSGLSHMSEAYGRAVLADETATGLMAHELAHQWWGDVVTNHDWTHFWLNEGFATFMATAYRERSQGRDAYLKDVDGWRRRVAQLRAAGHDRPLVFPDWNRPTADDRAVVYQKGALALHELRQQLGDAAFWTAVRAYTTAHAGQAVRSADLQRAFEASSRRTLAAFFDAWVGPS
jgi:aminopeptidase N